MKKTNILSAILAGSLMAFGGFGCSHNSGGPAEPNTVSGQAGTTTSGVDSTGNPTTGDTSGPNGMRSTNPGDQPGAPSGQPIDQRQNVNGRDGSGTMDPNGNPIPPSTSPGTNPGGTAPGGTAPSPTTTPGSTTTGGSSGGSGTGGAGSGGSGSGGSGGGGG